MLDSKTYQQELIRMFDSLRKTHKGELSCDGIHCDDCPFSRPWCKHPFSVFASCNIVEKWSKEHPEKHKVSQLEYDILLLSVEYSLTETTFDDFDMLTDLLEKGYFKGATLETNVGDYFDNCEVVDK